MTPETNKAESPGSSLFSEREALAPSGERQSQRKSADTSVYRAVAGSATSVKPLSLDEAEHTVALGREIRRRRLAAEVGQRELGRLCGVGFNYMWRVEHGERRVRRSLLERMAAWLIPVGEWLYEDGPSDEQERQVVDELCAIAGPALAPERVPFAEREVLARRRLSGLEGESGAIDA